MSPVRSLELPVPFDHQRAILLDGHRIKCPCIGRQGGKTLFGGQAATVGHGPLDETGIPVFRGAIYGTEVWWVTKDFPTSEKIWKDLGHYTRRWGPDLEKSEKLKRIDFPGGGSITLRSAHDPDALRGDTIGGLIGDEVAFWHPESLSTLRPTLAVRRAWQILISTPFGFNWFFDEWRRGADRLDPDYASWQWPSSINPAFPAEEFEKARARERPEVFAREYLAEFSVSDGEMFRRDWFRYYRQDEEWIHPDLGDRVSKAALKTIIAADFALTARDRSDFTAICVMSVAPDGRMFVRDLIRSRLKASEIIPMLVNLQEKWHAPFVYVEKSGAGVHLNEDARRAGVRIVERSIHRKIDGNKGEDKVERANKASESVELGRVMFLKAKQPNGSYAPVKWVGDLIAECCAFTGAKGGKDDQVDALSLGVLGAIMVKKRPDDDSGPSRRRRRDDNDDGDGRTGWLIGR